MDDIEIDAVGGEVVMDNFGGLNGGGGGVVRFRNGSFIMVSKMSHSGMGDDQGEDTLSNVSKVVVQKYKLYLLHRFREH